MEAGWERPPVAELKTFFEQIPCDGEWHLFERHTGNAGKYPLYRQVRAMCSPHRALSTIYQTRVSYSSSRNWKKYSTAGEFEEFGEFDGTTIPRVVKKRLAWEARQDVAEFSFFREKRRGARK